MAIDPGGKTGIAVRLPNRELKTWICESLYREGKKILYKPDELYETLSMNGITQVVYENFSAQLVDHYMIHTIRLIGAIEALCTYRGISFKRHVPQDRYPFLLTAEYHLKKQGSPFMVHEKDALAHLLRFEHDNK